MPRPQDVFAILAGGQQFTKLDLSSSYLQLAVVLWVQAIHNCESPLRSLYTTIPGYNWRCPLLLSLPTRSLTLSCRVYPTSYATLMTFWSLDYLIRSIFSTCSKCSYTWESMAWGCQGSSLATKFASPNEGQAVCCPKRLLQLRIQQLRAFLGLSAQAYLPGWWQSLETSHRPHQGLISLATPELEPPGDTHWVASTITHQDLDCSRATITIPQCTHCYKATISSETQERTWLLPQNLHIHLSENVRGVVELNNNWCNMICWFIVYVMYTAWHICCIYYSFLLCPQYSHCYHVPM